MFTMILKEFKIFFPGTLLSLMFFFGASAMGKTYTTSFPITENPISEGGQWVVGSAAGSNLWGNVQTTPGFAFGVNEPTSYGDPTALLQGKWGPDQTAQTTVKIATTPTGAYQEAEVRLRTTISSGTITGYEVYASVVPSSPYCHIASWGGPNGVWVNMDVNAPSLFLKNGDVLKGTITGTNPVTITMFVNGTQVVSVKDSGTYTFSDGKHYGPWTTGNPGIGFYNNRDNNWNRFGFSSFTASDGISAAEPPIASTPVHQGYHNDIVEILNLKGRILSRYYGNRNDNHLKAGRPLAPGVYIVKVKSGHTCALYKIYLTKDGQKIPHSASNQAGW
jgi:hypothetical protein